MTGTRLSRKRALARVSAGEALSRNDKHTEYNKRKASRVASQTRKRNEKGEVCHGCLVLNEARRGRIYCRRDMYETSILRNNG